MAEQYLIPDLLAENLRVVFCGTALGRISFEKQAYYANPGNYFWRTLHSARFIPHPIQPADYPELLTYEIGLTDMCKIAYGNDDQIPQVAYDREALRRKVEHYQPAWLAFTSKNAASAYLGKGVANIVYGEQVETIRNTRLFVLPSPSGHARKWWDARWWNILAEKA